MLDKKDLAWKSMEALLDEHMPTSKNKRRLLYWPYAATAALLLVFVYKTNFDSSLNSSQVNKTEISSVVNENKLNSNDLNTSLDSSENSYSTENNETTLHNSNTSNSNPKKTYQIIKNSNTSLSQVDKMPIAIEDLDFNKSSKFDDIISENSSFKNSNEIKIVNSVVNDKTKVITDINEQKMKDITSANIQVNQSIANQSILPLSSRTTSLDFIANHKKPGIKTFAGIKVIDKQFEKRFSLSANILNLLNINNTMFNPGLGFDLGYNINNKYSLSFSPSFYKISNTQFSKEEIISDIFYYVNSQNDFSEMNSFSAKDLKTTKILYVQNNRSIVLPLSIGYKISSNVELRTGPSFIYEKNRINKIDEKSPQNVLEVSSLDVSNDFFSAALTNKSLAWNLGVNTIFKRLQFGLNLMLINNEKPSFNSFNTNNNVNTIFEAKFGYRFIGG
jgi:hypothetical protein